MLRFKENVCIVCGLTEGYFYNHIDDGEGCWFDLEVPPSSYLCIKCEIDRDAYERIKEITKGI